MSAKMSLDEVLTTKNLKDILGLLYPARTKWFNLGLALGLDHNTLKAIEDEYRSNDKALREMVLTLVEKRASKKEDAPQLTWRVLCEALCKDTVGRNDVAVSIEEDCMKRKVKKGRRRSRSVPEGEDLSDFGASPPKKPKVSPTTKIARAKGATPSTTPKVPKEDKSENGCSTRLHGAPTIKEGKIENDYILMKIAKDIGARWLEVGLALGMEYSKLRSRIDDKYTTPVPSDRKAMDMLQEWKSQAKDSFTYKTLATALEKEDLNTCARTHCYTDHSTVTENEQ